MALEVQFHSAQDHAPSAEAATLKGAAFTPGPWSVYAPDPVIIVNAEGSSLGEMSPGDPFISAAEAKANAILAAAAPMMFQTLAAIQTLTAEDVTPTSVAVWAIAAEALDMAGA